MRSPSLHVYGGLLLDYVAAAEAARHRFRDESRVRGIGLALDALSMRDNIEGDDNHPIRSGLMQLVWKIEQTFSLERNVAMRVFEAQLRLREHGIEIAFPTDDGKGSSGRNAISIYVQCTDDEAEDIVFSFDGGNTNVRMKAVDHAHSFDELLGLEANLIHRFSQQKKDWDNKSLQAVAMALMSYLSTMHKREGDFDEWIGTVAAANGTTKDELKTAIDVTDAMSAKGYIVETRPYHGSGELAYRVAVYKSDQPDALEWYDDFEELASEAY